MKETDRYRRWTRALGMAALVSVGLHTATAAPAATGGDPMASALREDSDEYGRVQRCRPGPWGEIEYLNIVIEAPERTLPSEPPPGTIPPWYFSADNLDRLRADLAATGLDAPRVDELVRTATTNAAQPGWLVQPTEDLVLSLAPDVRTRLYRLLAAFPANAPFRWPYRFEDADPAHWFARAELSETTRALLQRLVYRRDELCLFSDLPVIMAHMPTADERRSLLQALGRQATVLPRLNVRPDEDIEPLVSYWGGAGREDVVRPLLESIHRSPSGWTIGITSLLPPLPRERLYTFDTPNGHGYHDCHWSSMNFFNTEPDERFRDPAFVKQTILDHYRVVNGDYRMGDLILLRDAQGEVVHSCNYVADNLVYTKNGGEQSQPWVIMTLEDLLQYYAVSAPLRPVFLRAAD